MPQPSTPTEDDLLARVVRIHAADDPVSWPPPRSFDDMPREEEYSRVTDPARYRVLRTRARAWARVLADVPGLAVEPLEPGESDGGGLPVVEAWRVNCTRERTAVMHLLVHDAPDATLAAEDMTPHVVLAVRARPGDVPASDTGEAVDVALVPDCGCDACDGGSEDLLEALDRQVLDVVTGPVVALRHPDWSALVTRSSEGVSSGSAAPLPGHGDAVRWCRQALAGDVADLPPGATVAVAGVPWDVLA
ncbi:DUF6226 family protein [Mobilicoccus pelagius]|uniref:Uncharacterized protein n=1 Tax=Mobilicoccus pelagius NBRC 104925 TaxID=1089455 RepID=H5UTQ1_9MICO|nr:DUF6226 family protein [Mobilicoccus pelagius]GAB49109.1 hypothetical protein MOPEL_096_01170 [Mobilicoccus pelagius NBRC 104925]